MLGAMVLSRDGMQPKQLKLNLSGSRVVSAARRSTGWKITAVKGTCGHWQLGVL